MSQRQQTHAPKPARSTLAVQIQPISTQEFTRWIEAKDAGFYEDRGHQFDILAFAGTTDRIGVSYTVLGHQLASGSDLHNLWTQIQTTAAAGPADSRALLEQHLVTLS